MPTNALPRTNALFLDNQFGCIAIGRYICVPICTMFTLFISQGAFLKL